MVKAILRGLGDELRSGAHAWRMDALGCDLVSKEADFTEELSVRHVPLQECSRLALAFSWTRTWQRCSVPRVRPRRRRGHDVSGVSRAHPHVEMKRSLHTELLEAHPAHHND